MKIVIISDTHTFHGRIEEKDLPEADVIICCGDISSRGYKHEIQNFLYWFSNLNQYEYKVLIAGNHDFFFETKDELDKELISEVLSEYPNIIYLEDSSIEIEGKIFYGSPQTPWFYNWAFNCLEDKLKETWSKLPDKIDVLITHGPPYKILDKCISGDNAGDPYLLEAVKKIKPIIHCFGHIHESFFVKKEFDTIFINASILDENYQVKNKPVIINI